MQYEHHAFISYAHIDNEPLTAGQKGWVTQFHGTLQTMLSQRLGERVRIWRDEKLQGNDVFSDEIIGQLSRTALLISILSPRYVKSEWCTRELTKFCEWASGHGGLNLGAKSRLVKVVKMPVDGPWPQPLERLLGYEFYDARGSDPIELDPAFGEEARVLYLQRLSRLALEMSAFLKALLLETVEAPGPSRRVFVADCGRDMREARERIATDLRMHGYEVLPDRQLPLTEDELLPELETLLNGCVLSIHLVGRSAGTMPDGPSSRSLVMLENDAAARRSAQGALKRLVWIPEGTTGERPEQQAFIESLSRDAAVQAGADLLTGDIEALKGAVHASLKRLEQPPAPEPAAASGRRVVHLLMHEADRAPAVPLIKRLRARGVDVTVPQFAGSATELREAHTRALAACDAVLLYYGAGDEAWKVHQRSELRKQAVAATRTRIDWLCLAAPLGDDKALMQALAEPQVIDLLDGASDTALQPFLTALGVPVAA